MVLLIENFNSSLIFGRLWKGIFVLQDFNSNDNDDQVNEQNRRYHQQISSRGGAVGVLSPTTSDSTKSTPAKNVDKLVDMSTTCSSASSTASTKGSSSDERSLNKLRQSNSLQGNGARVVSKSNWAPEPDMETPPQGTPLMTALPAVGLRDTKIEIAGKPETIF